MKNHSKLIQPITFIDLLKYTTNYTTVDWDDSVVIYAMESLYDVPLILQLIPTGFYEIIIGFNKKNDDFSYTIYEIGSLKKLTSLKLEHHDTYIGIRMPINMYYFNNNKVASSASFEQVRIYTHSTQNSELENVISSLKNSLSFEEQILNLFNFFSSYKQNHSLQPLIIDILDMIEESRGSIKIADIATEFSYSERYIHYIFKKTFGFGPKEYCRYTRFQTALGEIFNNPFRSNLEFIQTIGYSDQAHFQRDFKTFTGMTPKQYIQLLTKSKTLT